MSKYIRNGYIEVLQQLTTLTWDGDIINKSARDELHKRGLVERVGPGWNIISADGIRLLESIGAIHS